MSHLMIAVLQGMSAQTKKSWLDTDLVQQSEEYDSGDHINSVNCITSEKHASNLWVDIIRNILCLETFCAFNYINTLCR